MEVNKKEILIEVNRTSTAPFMEDLRMLFTAWNDIRKEEQYLKFYKNDYPGNYVLEEYIDSKLLKVQYRLRFDTPGDKIAFLLRYE